jgi:indolepyruvate ferredoxin oxidoreductase
MAAHLEGKGASVLDFTGFAQKFGPVISYVRFGANPAAINQVRVDDGAADALIGGDVVVSSSPKASNTYRPGMRAVLNTAEMPTGDIVLNRDARLRTDARVEAIIKVTGKENLRLTNANRLAEELMGDAIYANMIMLGMAWQEGLVPVGLAAMLRAIELNGVAIERNKTAFAVGRLASADPAMLNVAEEKTKTEDLDAIVVRRAEFLAGYQNVRWAKHFRDLVERVRAAEASVGGGDALAKAVAKSLFKLMSYKDEYEVARLHMQTGFIRKLREEFEGDFTVHYHMAPPFLPLGLDHRGRPRKIELGQWMQAPMRLLARLKFLRGSAFDPFGYSAERKMERELISWYEALIETMLEKLPQTGAARLLPIAEAAMDIRGYGPVKKKAVTQVKARVEKLLAELDTPEAFKQAA